MELVNISRQIVFILEKIYIQQLRSSERKMHSSGGSGQGILTDYVNQRKKIFSTLLDLVKLSTVDFVHPRKKYIQVDSTTSQFP